MHSQKNRDSEKSGRIGNLFMKSGGRTLFPLILLLFYRDELSSIYIFYFNIWAKHSIFFKH
jgi:hypothetical protein